MHGLSDLRPELGASRKRLAMLVLHDDSEREHAYGPANGQPPGGDDCSTTGVEPCRPDGPRGRS